MPADVRDRDALLAPYDVTGPFDEPELQSVAELATHVCGVPCAVVNLISEHFQHQVAAVGITPSVCVREDAMCAVTIGEPAPVEVPDAREDPRFAANPFVTGRLAHIRFYAASQLRAPSGAVLGTLCVFDEAARELTAEQRHALDLLAGQAVGALELRRAYRALTVTVRELAEARDELLRSNSRLAAFAGQVSHDLRNPLAGVTGFLELLVDHPAVAGEATAVAHVDRALAAAGRMRDMVDDLLAYARVGGSLRTERVDLGVLLREVLDDTPRAPSTPRDSISASCPRCGATGRSCARSSPTSWRTPSASPAPTGRSCCGCGPGPRVTAGRWRSPTTGSASPRPGARRRSRSCARCTSRARSPGARASGWRPAGASSPRTTAASGSTAASTAAPPWESPCRPREARPARVRARARRPGRPHPGVRGCAGGRSGTRRLRRGVRPSRPATVDRGRPRPRPGPASTRATSASRAGGSSSSCRPAVSTAPSW